MLPDYHPPPSLNSRIPSPQDSDRATRDSTTAGTGPGDPYLSHPAGITIEDLLIPFEDMPSANLLPDQPIEERCPPSPEAADMDTRPDFTGNTPIAVVNAQQWIDTPSSIADKASGLAKAGGGEERPRKRIREDGATGNSYGDNGMPNAYSVRRAKPLKLLPLHPGLTTTERPSTPVRGGGRTRAPSPRTPAPTTETQQNLFTFYVPTPQTLPGPPSPVPSPRPTTRGRLRITPPEDPQEDARSPTELEEGQVDDAHPEPKTTEEEGYPDALLSPARGNVPLNDVDPVPTHPTEASTPAAMTPLLHALARDGTRQGDLSAPKAFAGEALNPARPQNPLANLLAQAGPTICRDDWDQLLGAIQHTSLPGWPGMENALPPPPSLESWPEGLAWLQNRDAALRRIIGMPDPNSARTPLFMLQTHNGPQDLGPMPHAQARAPPATMLGGSSSIPGPAAPLPGPPAHTAVGQAGPAAPAQAFMRQASIPAALRPARAPEAPNPPGQDLPPPPLPELPYDIQNLIIAPRNIQGGGRITNLEHPLPRPHRHGFTGIQPNTENMFAREPADGFPRVRLDHPERLWAGLDDENRKKWLDTPNAVIGFVYNGRPVPLGGASTLANKVGNAVKAFLGLPKVSVVFAELPGERIKVDAKDLRTHPSRAFILPRLSEEHANTLWRIHILSAKNIALIFFPPLMRFDDYVGRITGFTHNDNDEVLTIIREKLNTRDVRALFVKYLRNNPARKTEDPETALRRVFDSLRLVPLGKGDEDEEVLFNFHIDTPAGSIAEWEEWLEAMLKIRWASPRILNGTGVIHRLGVCRGCCSIEHESDACPLPLLDEWITENEPPTIRTPRTASGPSTERGATNGRTGGRGMRPRLNFGRN